MAMLERAIAAVERTAGLLRSRTAEPKDLRAVRRRERDGFGEAVVSHTAAARGPGG